MEFPKLEELDEHDRIILERKLNCYRFTTNLTTDATGLQSIQDARGELICPRVFDGWSCWNETRAGETIHVPCPFFIIGFDPGRYAHKTCLSDGSWFRHPATNATWSNYTTCVDIEDLATRTAVIKIHQVGYAISILALVISLLIFCSFRCLECTRVHIHKHLFVSFIINNFLWLTWYAAVVTDINVLQNPLDGGWCIPLHIFVQYFMVANYFWMFCEGFYLYTLIVFTFTRAEGKLLTGFYIFGWFGPIFPVGLYAIFRSLDPLENNRCWIHESSYSWFLSIPVCISLISSLIFLIIILRTLLRKLHDNQQRNLHSRRLDSHDQYAIHKATKATLILIPLLGLHYLLIPFRPQPGSNWELIYEYISSISISLQGFCVSIIFCFANGEVRFVLRRRFCPTKSLRHGDYSCAQTTMSTMGAGHQCENGTEDEFLETHL